MDPHSEAKEPEVKAERWMRSPAQQEAEQPRHMSMETDREYFMRTTALNTWKKQWRAFWDAGFGRVFRVQELFEDRPDIIEMFKNKAGGWGVEQLTTWRRDS